MLLSLDGYKFMNDSTLMAYINRIKLALTQSSLVVFLLVGGSSFIIDMIVFVSLLTYGHWQPMLARITGFCIGLTLTWLGHRFLTFRHRKQLRTLNQLCWVISIAVLSGGVNLSSFYFLTLTLGEQPLVMIMNLAIGVLLGLVINWLGSNYITYKSQSTEVIA